MTQNEHVCEICCRSVMKLLNHSFQNCKVFQNWLNHYREIATKNMTQNEHVYAICCRLEVGCDVSSGGNVKTIEGYSVLDFEVASFSSFWDIPTNHFVKAADIDDSIKRKHIRVSLKKWRNAHRTDTINWSGQLIIAKLIRSKQIAVFIQL